MLEPMQPIDLKALIREVPDFPKPGIGFKDITPLFANGRALAYVVRALAEQFRPVKPDLVVGVESRGFVIGAPVAYELGCGFVLVRKPGKLPYETLRVEYELEYGSDALEIHRDAIAAGQRVLITDDLLATGGTMQATACLVRELGGIIAGYGFVVELGFLGGRPRLEGDGAPIVSLVRYD